MAPSVPARTKITQKQNSRPGGPSRSPPIFAASDIVNLFREPPTQAAHGQATSLTQTDAIGLPG
jgi:hypothetical protein